MTLLPVWDAWMMASRHRDRTIDAPHRPFVVDKSGNVASAVLRGGRVVGVWEIADSTLWFGALPGETLEPDELEAAAARLAGVDAIDSMRARDPIARDGGGQNAFHAPLTWGGRRPA